MTKLKLIAVALISLTIINSCDKEEIKTNSNFNIAMTGAQVIPPPPAASTATGRIEATYTYNTKTLSYKITWNGLGSAVTAIHIHGQAQAGAPSLAVQTISGFSTATSGSYSGSLFVDGVAIKEADLLAGRYYVDIHTTTPPYNSLGEIRGQLTFAQ